MRYVLALVAGCALITTAACAAEVSVNPSIDAIGVGLVETDADWVTIATDIRERGKLDDKRRGKIEARFSEIQSFFDSLGQGVALIEKNVPDVQCIWDMCGRHRRPFVIIGVTITLWNLDHYAAVLERLQASGARFPLVATFNSYDERRYADSAMALALQDAIAKGRLAQEETQISCDLPESVVLDVSTQEAYNRLGARFHELQRPGTIPNRIRVDSATGKEIPKLRVIRIVQVKFSVQTASTP